jgi:hypothetical protein
LSPKGSDRGLDGDAADAGAAHLSADGGAKDARQLPAAELARRQERAGLARATLQQWWQRDLARERTAWERDWSLGRGWEIRR